MRRLVLYALNVKLPVISTSRENPSQTHRIKAAIILSTAYRTLLFENIDTIAELQSRYGHDIVNVEKDLR